MTLFRSGVSSVKFRFHFAPKCFAVWTKNAAYNWHNMLKDALFVRGFMESLLDPYVFISKNMVILVYVDDCILITKESSTLDSFIDSLQNGPEKFVFTDEGKMSSYLGVDISRLTMTASS